MHVAVAEVLGVLSFLVGLVDPEADCAGAVGTASQEC